MARRSALPILVTTVAISALGLVVLGVLALDRALDNAEAAARQEARNASFAALRALRARTESQRFLRALDANSQIRVSPDAVIAPPGLAELRKNQALELITAESIATARAAEASGRQDEAIANLDRTLARTDRQDADRARLCAQAMWIAARAGRGELAGSYRARVRPSASPASVAASAALFDVAHAKLPPKALLEQVLALPHCMAKAVLGSMRDALEESAAKPAARSAIAPVLDELADDIARTDRLRRGLSRIRRRAASLRAQRSVRVEGVRSTLDERSVDEVLLWRPDPKTRGSGHAFVMTLAEFEARIQESQADSQSDASVAQGPNASLRLACGEAPEQAIPVFDGIYAIPTRAASSRRFGEHRTTQLLLLALALAFALGFGLLLRSLRREREALAARGDFLRSITHEVRTPLASIRLFAETLAAGRFENEDTRDEYTELIAVEAGRLSTLVENAIELGRTARGERSFCFEATDLVELLQESIALFEPLAREAKMEIHLHAPDSVEAELDRDGLRQVFANLFENARKYAKTGGRIDVSVRSEAKTALVDVRDYGPGIAQEERNRVFQRFVRGQAQESGTIPGAGLGLAIARGIAEAHGGTLQVTAPDREGEQSGACFTLRIPLHQGPGEQR